ncbi:hypothetical protein [Sphingomonas sp. 1P08PE]|uniref:hypothetical protein n=1 Tax=Sphingomonas sp. 1P08PE TaxID=554122 RepID=UPI0039A1C725
MADAKPSVRASVTVDTDNAAIPSAAIPGLIDVSNALDLIDRRQTVQRMVMIIRIGAVDQSQFHIEITETMRWFDRSAVRISVLKESGHDPRTT